MEIYAIGTPFPDDRYKGNKDCAVVSFRETSFDSIVLIDKPYAKEMEAFSQGPLNYGLYTEDKIPFLTLEFKGMGFDASFNILKLPQDHMKKWLDSDHNAMNLFLVESNSYQLLAMRSVDLHKEFMQDLRSVLSEQQKAFKDISQVDLNIRRITGKRSLTEMNNKAKKFHIG